MPSTRSCQATCRPTPAHRTTAASTIPKIATSGCTFDSSSRLSRMHKARLETFSDGVVAILITIMVLELRLPAGADWAALRSLGPTLCAYVLSFVYLGIYWNNHHHLFQLVDRVNGSMLWANLHLLFWLSLVPVATNWMGEHPREALPTAAYGGVLFFAAIAFTLLVRVIIPLQGPHS